MGLFSRRREEDRALAPRTVPPAMLGLAPLGSVTAESAMRIADAYACVRALSDAAASLPLIAYQRNGSARQRLDGPISGLLARPSPGTTQANLIGQLVAHLQLHGNAYVGKFREGGQVTQLSLLDPARVTPRIVAGRPRYALQGTTGETSDHGPEDVLHIHGMSVDGLTGLSPVRQARVALGLSQSLAEHAAGFFENGARPAGILRLNQFGVTGPGVADGPEGDPGDLEVLRDAWNRETRGNAHRIAVVSGEVDFTPLALPMEDVEFIAQRKLSAVEVARIFRVPPWIIGADSGESMTYSNVEQQGLAFVTYSLRPWLVLIEQALSSDPDLFAPRTYCEFLLDALLRADTKTRAETYALALDPISGWMDRDEVRRLENLA